MAKATKYATPLHALVAESPSLRGLTKRDYLSAVDRYVVFAGDDPRGWTRQTTQAFYRHLLDAPMKPQSANKIMSGIQYAATWYASQLADPAKDFAVIQQAPGKTVAVRESLTEAQAKALLDTCVHRHPRDLRDFALMVVSLETGMRRMSLGGMAWENISRAPVSVAVPTKGRDELYLVPLSDTAVAALGPWRRWLDRQKHQRAKLSGAVFRALYPHAGGPMLGGGLSGTSLTNLVQERGRMAGIRSIHPHIFRHTFITWRITEGLSNFHIAAVTGHQLGGAGFGALPVYADRQVLAERARQSTPAWLAAYVRDYVEKESR